MPSPIVYRPPFRKRGQVPFFLSASLDSGDAVGSGGVEIGGTAAATYGGGVQTTSSVVVEWDFDNDGDFDQPEEDITSYVLGLETFTGRDWPSLLTGFAGPGKLTMVLNNDDDRFSYFNEDSPLNQGDFSLKTGRKIRVRTSTATNPDPTILAKDRFNRADGSLDMDEFSSPWSGPLAADFEVSSMKAVASIEGSPHIATLDLGVADYYVQATLSSIGSLNNKVGVVYRYVDTTNYSYMSVNLTNGVVGLFDVVAGVLSTVSSTTLELYSGITIGALLDGTSVTGYVEGVALLSGTAINTSAELAGLYALWGSGDTAPEIDNFYASTGLVAETEGILWTGDVSELVARVTPGPHKVANLNGEGWLSKLATQKVQPPTSTSGRKTGLLVGNILTTCNLASPPGPISEGDITTGVYAADEQDAIAAARDVEETEFGFLYETQEGPIGFDSRSARTGVSPSTGFSDAVGAQFGYHGIEPMDWRREVFNRVVAGLSPYTEGVEAVLYTDPGPYVLGPGDTQDLVATYSGSVAQWTGHTRDVLGNGTATVEDVTNTTNTQTSDTVIGVTCPATVNANDVLVTILGITIDQPGIEFSDYPTAPSGWTRLAAYSSGFAGETMLVVAAKIAAGTEDGTTVNYGINPSVSAGVNKLVVAHTYRISSAYTTGTITDAVEVSAVVESSGDPNPASITPSWGATSTVFFVACSVEDQPTAITTFPSGYANSNNTVQTGSNVDLRLGSARKTASTTTEDPGAFDTTNGADTVAITIAVRSGATTTPITSSTPSGPSGAFTISYDSVIGGASQTHANIEVTGIPLVQGSVVQVQLDDTNSQDDHNAIRTYRNPANLFASTSDATEYAQLVLDTFAGDRPILAIRFWAVKTAAYRNQAIRRRVSDKITLVAENNAGLGISQDFFIESISHKFSYGTTLWETVWELSPA